MKEGEDSRTLARILAVQYIFTLQYAENSEFEFLNFEPNTLLHLLEAKKVNHKLYEKLIDGVRSNTLKIIGIIQKYAKSWPIEQINPVDLSILKIAVWEGFIGKITPERVVIDQAVEIAKIFGEESNGAFVNGVLGTLLKDIEEGKFNIDK